MRYALPLLLIAALCVAPRGATAQDCGESITVTSGDTLYEIAEECETTVAALMRNNPQVDERSVIRVGWTLDIPDSDAREQPDRDRQTDRGVDRQPTGGEREYTIRPGDTLGEIASRYGVAVSDLMRANPQINDPAEIEIGWTLTIPGGGETGRDAPERGHDERAREGATWTGDVSIQPESGPPGTSVRVDASGFPANSSLNVGAGPAGSEYEVIRGDVRADADGRLTTSAELPDTADPRQQWIFVVETDDHRIKGRSEPFVVQTGDAGQDPNRVVVRGRLTGSGVECPAMRSQDGTLYTLVGETGRFEEGDYVRVEGSIAEYSVCMQGTTINVDRVMVWKEGGGIGDADNGNLRQVHRIEGILQSGAECPVVSADGRAFALAGDLEGFEQGDRVYVEGVEAEASTCMQDQTLEIRTIRSAQ